jgi:hypothetical protein
MIVIGSIVKTKHESPDRTLDLIGEVTNTVGSKLELKPVAIRVFVNKNYIVGFSPYEFSIEVDTKDCDVELIDGNDFDNYIDALNSKLLKESELNQLILDNINFDEVLEEEGD